VSNSNIYDKLKPANILPVDSHGNPTKPSLRDLNFIKGYFSQLGLDEVVRAIENDSV